MRDERQVKRTKGNFLALFIGLGAYTFFVGPAVLMGFAMGTDSPSSNVNAVMTAMVITMFFLFVVPWGIAIWRYKKFKNSLNQES
jgi:lipopolysaccharide export LptBFGC system permease protein LptF